MRRTAGIEGVDLTAVGSFRNCTGKCLAGCCPAARIGVVTNAGKINGSVTLDI